MGFNFDRIFKLSLPQIQKYFQQKIIKPSGAWTEVLQEEHNHAFVVANVTRADMLQELYDRVDKAIGEGITFAQFKKDLPTFTEEWKKRRLPTIYNTNLSVAYSRGRYESMKANAERRPYWRYKCQMLPTSREAHKALHGKIFRWDDPIWNTLFPPNGWGCKCEVEPLTAEEVGDKPIENSKKNLIGIQKNLDEKTIQLVTGFKDPQTGVVTAPSAGWNYNPGISDYTPDMRKYNSFIADYLRLTLNTAGLKMPFIEGKHSFKDDLKMINPGFGLEKGTDTNCYSCVYAYEARRRGLDVTAMPGEAISGKKVLSGFKNVEFKSYTKEKIEEEMKKLGNGTRMEILAEWGNNKSHVFIAEQVDGETHSIDPQSSLDCRALFDMAKHILAARIDNAFFSEKVKTFIKGK